MMSAAGPVVFAYDGSELAKLAVEEAGALLSPGRDALVVTVWRPFDVGFMPAAAATFDARNAAEVRREAENTAAEGAGLAAAAGFRSQAVTVESNPTWKGIVGLSDEHDASLIVLGSHGRTGLSGVLLGSVAGAVAAHSRRSVLITHRRRQGPR